MDTTNRIDAALAAMNLAADNHAKLLVSLGYNGVTDLRLSVADNYRVMAAYTVVLATEQEYADACDAAGWNT